MTVMQIVQQLFGSMGITMEIFFVTLITSLILGLGLALIRMSKNPILSVIAKFYISVMRGTPLMLQLLVVYFGPFFIFGMQITPSYRLKAVLIGFALNYAAYFAEIYRSGIAAIPVGQYEAARMLGYSKTQTFAYIVMPQVIKRIIPPVANETIGQGYISGFYIGGSRSIYRDETAGGFPVIRCSVYCGGYFLLHF